MSSGAVVVDDAVLRARGLVKEFRGFRAVDGVDIDLKRGEIHALIGPNGAGKTTCFNLLTRFLDVTAGRIEFDGHDITSLSPARVAQLGMVRSFQISSVFPQLTALDNVKVALLRDKGWGMQFWKGRSRLSELNDEAMRLLGEVNLQEAAATRAQHMPYGQRRALELATTMATQPRLLLLDEPTQGMGHEDVERVVELIRRVAQGRTVLLVEHNMSVVSRIAHRITVLAHGRVIATGDYATVAADPLVREAYMGSSADRTDRTEATLS